MGPKKDAQNELLKQITEKLSFANNEILEAFKKVPRKQFLSYNNPLFEKDDQAYEDMPFPIQYNGIFPASSSTMPSLMVEMLNLLQPGKGQRILEIGTASGYNAAILAEIVGDNGQVITTEIEKPVFERARNLLTSASNIEVLKMDASPGVISKAPFDRIVVTCAVMRIPEQWIKQLKEGGKMVLPYIKKGLQYLLVLVKNKNSIKLRFASPCGFIPIQGPLYDKAEEASAIKGLLESLPHMKQTNPPTSNADKPYIENGLIKEIIEGSGIDLVYDESSADLQVTRDEKLFFRFLSDQAPCYLSRNLTTFYYRNAQDLDKHLAPLLKKNSHDQPSFRISQRHINAPFKVGATPYCHFLPLELPGGCNIGDRE